MTVKHIEEKKVAKPRKPRGRPKKAAPRAAATTRKEQHAAPSARSLSRKAIKRTYRFAVGRRKTAIARVRYTDEGNGVVTINGKPLESYFPSFILQNIVRAPIAAVGKEGKGTLSIKVQGGGYHSQAESIRHGIARVLLLVDNTFRTTLKSMNFLRRDARAKERKKYGLRRARRAPQWQKR